MPEHCITEFPRRSIVRNRYEVLKLLGEGSKGLVYLCRDLQLGGRRVVLKVLANGIAGDNLERLRFRDEVTALYELNHPFIVRAYEYIDDGSLLAVSMEYVSGGDLANLLALKQKIPISQIHRFLNQICSGVKAIHEAGIVHHDLKPENLLLTADGDIKISDFGISRMSTSPKFDVDEEAEPETLFGTVYYLSPEYIERSEFDERSDIYSIGVIAYELITNQIPFYDEQIVKSIKMRLARDPEPPHRLRRDCPESLSQTVMKAISRDPKKRHQSANELLCALATLDLESERELQAARFQELENSAFLKVPMLKNMSFDGETGKPIVTPVTSLASIIPDPSVSQLRVKGLVDKRKEDMLAAPLFKLPSWLVVLLIAAIWIVVILSSVVAFEMFLSPEPQRSFQTWQQAIKKGAFGETRYIRRFYYRLFKEQS